MQLVEKTIQTKADINASFSSTSSEAVSIPSILETDTDNETVQHLTYLREKQYKWIESRTKLEKNSNLVII